MDKIFTEFLDVVKCLDDNNKCYIVRKLYDAFKDINCEISSIDESLLEIKSDIKDNDKTFKDLKKIVRWDDESLAQLVDENKQFPLPVIDVFPDATTGQAITGVYSDIGDFTVVQSYNPILVDLGKSSVKDNFYYGDNTTRPLIVPSSAVALANSIRNLNKNMPETNIEIPLTNGKTVLSVQQDVDFVNSFQLWDTYGLYRLKKSLINTNLPPVVDNLHFYIDPNWDGAGNVQEHFKHDGKYTVPPEFIYDEGGNLNVFGLPINITGNIVDQGVIGSCYANATANIIYLSRIVNRLGDLKIKKIGDMYVYGYNTVDKSTVFYNYVTQYVKPQEAAYYGVIALIDSEIDEYPSRSFIQYVSKRRKAEEFMLLDPNTSVLDQGNSLTFTLKGLRTGGCVPEKAYRYPAFYTETDANLGIDELEEFVQKYSFSPDGYLCNRALERKDVLSLQAIPIYKQYTDLFDDFSSYVPLPTVKVTGLTDDENRYLLLIKNYLNNNVSLFHNWKLFNSYTNNWTNGNIYPPSTTSENSGYHTSVIIGYDDNKTIGENKGVFVIQNSWGTKNNGSYNGYYYMTYYDFFKYYTTSIWALRSNDWVTTNIYEEYEYTNPAIYNSLITQSAISECVNASNSMACCRARIKVALDDLRNGKVTPEKKKKLLYGCKLCNGANIKYYATYGDSSDEAAAQFCNDLWLGNTETGSKSVRKVERSYLNILGLEYSKSALPTDQVLCSKAGDGGQASQYILQNNVSLEDDTQPCEEGIDCIGKENLTNKDWSGILKNSSANIRTTAPNTNCS